MEIPTGPPPSPPLVAGAQTSPLLLLSTGHTILPLSLPSPYNTKRANAPVPTLHIDSLSLTKTMAGFSRGGSAPDRSAYGRIGAGAGAAPGAGGAGAGGAGYTSAYGSSAASSAGAGAGRSAYGASSAGGGAGGYESAYGGSAPAPPPRGSEIRRVPAPPVPGGYGGAGGYGYADEKAGDPYGARAGSVSTGGAGARHGSGNGYTVTQSPQDQILTNCIVVNAQEWGSVQYVLVDGYYAFTAV